MMRVTQPPARVPGPLVLLLIALAAAGGAVRVAASRTPFHHGRQLMYHACYQTTACVGPEQQCKLGCPSPDYKCVRYDTNGPDRGGTIRSTCTNTFKADVDLPVLPKTTSQTINSLTDKDLCTGWVGSPAMSLAPMYNNGDCAKERAGVLYAMYDCNTRQVCFKATSCVGKYAKTETTEGPIGDQIPGYECPGVACGCKDDVQANRECQLVDVDNTNNWFFLVPPCDTNKNLKVRPLPAGFTFSKRSGWEHCMSAAANTVWSVQAHFNVRGMEVDNNGNPTSSTIDTMFPNEVPHYIKFKTPQCDGPDDGPPPAPTCPTVSAASPVLVCTGTSSVTVSYTVTSGGPVKVTTTCPGGSAQVDTYATALNGVTLSRSCGKPSGGWQGTEQFTVQVQDNDATTTCTGGSEAVSATVDIDISTTTSTITVAKDSAPNICYNDDEAVAMFRVTLGDTTATPTFTVDTDADCDITSEEKLTATPLVYSVEVTCTSNGYIADVPIDLDVTATSSASCPTPASLTASVVVDDPPNIDLAAPEAVCVSGATFPAEFTVDEEVNLEDFEDWDVDVKPLDAGGEVTGVTCEAARRDGSIISSVCQLEDGGAFETSDIEFTGVRLTVIAENSCGTASDTASATLPVTLAPSITLSVDDNDKVCDDTDDEAIAVFGYTAYHKVVSINDFTVLAPSGCSKQLRGSNQVVVTCDRALNSGNLLITLKGEVQDDDEVCPAISDTASATIEAVRKADLTITKAADRTICPNVRSITADFAYTVTNLAAAAGGQVKFDVTPSMCSVPSQSASSPVTVTCNILENQPSFTISLSGEATSRTPCAKDEETVTTSITVDTPPTVTLAPVVTQPLRACASPSPLEASFTYSITSASAATVVTTAKVMIGGREVTATCTPIGAPTNVAASTTTPVSGTFVMSCTGNFPVNSQPSIIVKMTLTKNGCVYEETATANFRRLLCCVEGTSYAALVIDGNRQTCFKPSTTSGCTDKGNNWGFYVKDSAMTAAGTDDVKFITGGGNDCTHGQEVGSAKLQCIADSFGKPTSLEFTVNNYEASLLKDQHYYVGCKPVTTCSPPAYGGTVVKSGTCALSSTVAACGGKFPANTNPTTTNGVTTQTFRINVMSSSSCTSCNQVYWVVHQSGEYRGDANLNQCTGFPQDSTSRTAPKTGKKGGRKRGRKTSP